MIKTVRNEEEWYEEIKTNANESCGVIQWARYDFNACQLLLVYRLDDNVYTHNDIPAGKWQEVKDVIINGSLRDEEAYFSKFEIEFPGEAI